MFNLGIDWERNGMQFQQYTATTMENTTENPEPGLSVVLNSVTVMNNPLNVTFDSTVTAVVSEGLSSGDIITCGNSVLMDNTTLTANYIAIRKYLYYCNNNLNILTTWPIRGTLGKWGGGGVGNSSII
jgi:hypothetical protein